MVLQKRLDYGINGYQVPPMPYVPKSAKGKRSVRKKTADNQTCAFDLLAAVAGQLLHEGESSLMPNRSIGTLNGHSGNYSIKEERLIDEKPLKDKICDLGNFSETTLGPDIVSHAQVTPKKLSLSVNLAPSGPAAVILKSDSSNEEACIEKCSPYIGEFYGGKDKDKTALNMCCLEDRMDVDAKPHALLSSDNKAKGPQCGDRILQNSCSLKCWDEKLLVNRDDDEKFSGCASPSLVTDKTLKHQGIEPHRLRKQLATKFWKVATTMTKDRELSNTEMKPSYRNRKVCYTRQRTRRSLFKRRKLFQRCSILASNGENRVSSPSINGHLRSYGSEDLHVKLTIKSFRVPELFIEIPENSTVGSLKRTVMEAVTAILGGELHVGVLLQGKRVRDDNKTLVQAGISHGDKLDHVGFTLEPDSSQSTPLLIGSEEPPHLLPCDAVEPLTKFPDMVTTSDGEKSNVSPEFPLTLRGNCLESDHGSVHSPAKTLALDKTTEDACPLIAIPSMSVEAMPMVSLHKPRQGEIGQRRIRRPFSVTEVEALVHAVEKLGTGRWRDVKIRAFDNAKHRTYVDLKDKWKTLVHTARIAPQQRRGEPVPQELLDRVLAAHAYWTEQQALLQGKSPTAEACLLI